MPITCSPSPKGEVAKQYMEFKLTCWKAGSQIRRPVLTSLSMVTENKMICFKSIELCTSYQKG